MPMPSVFLSYDRDDLGRARHFAQVLENAGHQVWWDTHVRGGAEFSKAIEEALATADVIVVLWSKDSVESAWVRDEASAGRDTGRLLPVTIDGTSPPLGFRQFQAIDLSRWKGRGRPPQLEMLLAEVDAMSKSEKPPVVSVKPRLGRPRFASRNWRIAAAGVAGLASIAAILEWAPWSRPHSAPTVLVTAGRNDATSQELARDFAVQLGGVSLVQSGSLRMITSSQQSSEKPALALEVTSLAEPQTTGARLLLRATADGTVIWSGDFEQGPRSIADMKLQMAFSAARVLGCAGDALAASDRTLPGETRALYLSSCGHTTEGVNYDPQTIIASLSKVVAAAPRFAPAWRILLPAEAAVIDDTDRPASIGAKETLRAHIAGARRLEPHMPEATLAEASLVPLTDLVTRTRLIDQAYRDGPASSAVLLARTNSMQRVGRMREALGMAYEAVQADPSSPGALDNFISALMYSGQADSAEQQLRHAEQLWLGTSALDDLEWRFYLRFGDPKVGMQMASNRMVSPSLLKLLTARENPTKENVDKLISFYESGLHGEKANLPTLSFLSQAFGPFHRENELYAIALSWPNQQDLETGTETWFRPALHEFRRDPRFMQLAARTPLLRYWRTTGKWPDFCDEPGLPYNCEKEAAKLADRAS